MKGHLRQRMIKKRRGIVTNHVDRDLTLENDRACLTTTDIVNAVNFSALTSNQVDERNRHDVASIENGAFLQ